MRLARGKLVLQCAQFVATVHGRREVLALDIELCIAYADVVNWSWVLPDDAECNFVLQNWEVAEKWRRLGVFLFELARSRRQRFDAVVQPPKDRSDCCAGDVDDGGCGHADNGETQASSW